MANCRVLINYCLVVGLLWSASQAATAQWLNLDSDHNRYQLGSVIQYVADPDQQESPYSLLHESSDIQWQPHNRATLNLGYKDETYWLKLQLDARATHIKHWYLVIENPLLDIINVYQQIDGQPRIIYASGSARPFARRSIEYRHFVIPLDIYAPTTYLIMVRSDTSLQVPAYLIRADHFWSEIQLTDSLLWLFYGLMLALILYNLALYLTIWDSSYLAYVIYISLFTLYQFMGDGFLFQHIWPDGVAWNYTSMQVTGGLSAVFANLFAWHFLQLRTYAHRLGKAILVTAMVMLLATIFAPYLPPLIASQTLMVSSVISVSLLLLAGIQSFRHGFKPAKFFVIAWLGLLATLVIYALSKIGIIPGHFLFNHSIKFGSAFEAFMLSIALGYRIRLIRDQSLKDQSNAIAKSRFLARMSHEIRTPMNGMLGMIELLKQTPLNTSQAKYLDTLSTSGNTLVTLVDEILDHARLENGKISLDEQPVEIKTLVEQAFAMVEPLANDKGLKLNYVMDEALPNIICADAFRLKQILLNLLGNAIKFTSNGIVHIRISRHKQDYLMVEVMDTGIGIPENMVSTLFNPFAQIDTGKVLNAKGTGLGLSICKQLVQLMGGQIGVHSEQNKGSNFWFYIPLKTAEKKPAIKAAEESNNTSENCGMRILVVEDNPINQAVIEAMLKQLGHHCDITSRGEEALSILRDKHNYDLVFMDCDLPGIDGFETTVKLRDYEKQNRHQALTVIALTAHVLPEFRRAANDAGMDSFLSKPISLKILKSALNKVQQKEQAI